MPNNSLIEGRGVTFVAVIVVVVVVSNRGVVMETEGVDNDCGGEEEVEEACSNTGDVVPVSYGLARKGGVGERRIG